MHKKLPASYNTKHNMKHEFYHLPNVKPPLAESDRSGKADYRKDA